MNRISFHTFGCRLNQSETSIIENSFAVNGYKIVSLSEKPDVVVVNTCTVTENGDADTHRLVNKINRLNPNARIALVGCQAQIQKEKLLKMPNVRWVVGNAKKMELLSIIGQSTLQSDPQVIAPNFTKESFTLQSAGFDSRHTRANLKVQDGCDFFCTFCEIPFARGRARSRVFNDLLTEARALVSFGHKEIVLTGVNLGTYQNDGKTILDVIDALEKIEDLKRIRISSIEPTTVPFELIERMGKTKLCRHLHIPLQSGSDEILKRMQRKYTRSEFADFILRARRTVPDICIGTDVIVGFPGETDRHFEQTAEFIREMPFAYAHVFSYSDRTLNKSGEYFPKVPIKTIHARSKTLRELSARKRLAFQKNLLQTHQDVLFEEQKNGCWQGTTDHYVKVAVKNSDVPLANTIARVLIQSATSTRVTGEIVSQ